MERIVITTRTQEDADKIVALLNESGLAETVRVEDEKEEKPPFRKLTPKDLALGIGRPATDEELMEYLTRPRTGEWKPLEQVIKEIKSKRKNK